MALNRQIFLQDIGQFGIREREWPRPGDGELLIQMGLVGVCGSDMHIFREGSIGDIESGDDPVLGHECMGTVVDTGPGVDAGLAGKRVAVEPHLPCGQCRWCRQGLENVCPDDRFLGLPPCPGAMQEYLVHPAHLVEPLPDSVSDKVGVLLEPLAIALHAVNLAKVKPGHTVVILGVGVLGSCVLNLLELQHEVRIIGVDLLPSRLDYARSTGASLCIQARDGFREDVVQAVMEETDGAGADVVFECAGVEDTFMNACACAAPAGHVCVIGIPEGSLMPFAATPARRKGLTIRMIRRSLNTLHPGIRLAEAHNAQLEKMVTHVFSAPDSQNAFETVGAYEDGVLKALIDMKHW